MFDKSKIETGLYGIVGFRQPFNPSYQIIDADNQVSDSGYYVTDHPMVKVEYLKETQDFDLITDADFNSYLKNIQESAISSVCSAIFNDANYIDRQILYIYAQNKVNTEVLPSGFIGHEICITAEKNIAFEISRVLLDFQGTGTIKLMLFNTAVLDPIFTKEIVITGTHQSEQLNWRVDNSGNTYKGKYYLGYLTDAAALNDLVPFKRDYEMSDVQSQITYLGVNNILFPGHSAETLPDLTTKEATSITTGLNPDITVFDDFTDLILNNKMLFGYAVYLDMCIKILSTYTSSIRSNRSQRMSEAQVVRMLQEIEGQEAVGTVKITGLRPMLLGELKRLEKEIYKLREGYFGGDITVKTLM